MAGPKPFEARWDDAKVADVLQRVRSYPWPPIPDVPDGWAYGCDAAYLKDLCAHWTDRYDWRAALADLNRFPQFTATVEDFDLHFLHVVGEAGGRRPLLITHGWPGSHYEFWQAVEPLAFPSRFGGSPDDAFDLVIPSLPGFGFSSKPRRPVGQRTTARLLNSLMTQVLGYGSYLAQGGDWGAMVTSWLGREHGGHARAIHLNMLGFRPHGGPQTPEEVAWAQKQAGMMDVMGAYFRLQVSKPQSIAWMGAGNPVGQAAWIAERFHDWSDLSARSMDEAYPKDRLLTNIMLYVMTDSFATGAWYYRGLVEEGALAFQPGERCETPTAFANFPGEPLYSAPPRSFAERAYNVVRWTDMPRGGHFAAMEEPGLFVDEVRAWAREV
ncbi:epoxide hydrolase family protein [Phenylobacterium sp.]|jgi:microsomal epoxide hydrolase|uniref:epoxide hydrolase family protein n=1 Tax=Phenylobacterium sp. TaxID=1871053 RepID=UPI002F93F136